MPRGIFCAVFCLYFWIGRLVVGGVVLWWGMTTNCDLQKAHNVYYV